ncbi:hypothetical protein FM106_11615 [Brachybacterium faecium]|nr:hypothetical protein FM106_11615 [Brachybacterium faecium]
MSYYLKEINVNMLNSSFSHNLRCLYQYYLTCFLKIIGLVLDNSIT